MSLVKYRKAGNKYYKVWLFKIDIIKIYCFIPQKMLVKCFLTFSLTFLYKMQYSCIGNNNSLPASKFQIKICKLIKTPL